MQRLRQRPLQRLHRLEQGRLFIAAGALQCPQLLLQLLKYAFIAPMKFLPLLFPAAAQFDDGLLRTPLLLLLPLMYRAWPRYAGVRWRMPSVPRLLCGTSG